MPHCPHDLSETVHRVDAPANNCLPSDRVALAEVVAADPTDRVRPYVSSGANKLSDEWLSLAEVVAANRAFAVEVSPRLLALDVDEPAGEYLRLLEILTALYIPHVELASGGSVHRRHLWVVLGDLPAALRESVLDGIGALIGPKQLRVGKALIRPPLSPHRSGSMSTLLAPISPAQAVTVLAGEGCGSHRAGLLVDALAAAQGDDRPLRDARTAKGLGVSGAGRVQTLSTRGITLRTADLISYGDRAGRYASRSEAQYAAELGLANAGLSESEAVTLILASPIGAKAREQRDPRGWLGADYRRAQAKVAATPAVRDVTKARAEASRLAERASKHRWARGLGVAPATITRVLAAVLSLCSDAGRLSDFSLSVRQVAEAAGVGRSAAARALALLINTGTLRLVSRGKGVDASIYSLNRSAPAFTGRERRGTLSHTPPTSASSVPLCSPPLYPEHDGWRHGALGGSALRVAGLLSDSPLPAGEIATALGCSLRWVRVLLARLARFDLAVSTPNGWLLGPSEARRASLEAAAEQLGTSGRGAAQRLKHELERAGWAAHLERSVVDRLGEPVPIEWAGELISIDRETGEILSRPPPKEIAA